MGEIEIYFNTVPLDQLEQKKKILLWLNIDLFRQNVFNLRWKWLRFTGKNDSKQSLINFISFNLFETKTFCLNII